ncbi:uncharacterized protein LOC101847758 [Aplysia californica]|uniref:Uncharacterized protein LOC101847758 n=1 Tax=Aplysia californica TaxID=6500 RepID=A0ABM0K1E8_APLCA|nr:uncharacterized protein LOC101847758 [Aplysia californica]
MVKCKFHVFTNALFCTTSRSYLPSFDHHPKKEAFAGVAGTEVSERSGLLIAAEFNKDLLKDSVRVNFLCGSLLRLLEHFEDFKRNDADFQVDLFCEETLGFALDHLTPNAVSPRAQFVAALGDVDKLSRDQRDALTAATANWRLLIHKTRATLQLDLLTPKDRTKVKDTLMAVGRDLLHLESKNDVIEVMDLVRRAYCQNFETRKQVSLVVTAHLVSTLLTTADLSGITEVTLLAGALNTSARCSVTRLTTLLGDPTGGAPKCPSGDKRHRVARSTPEKALGKESTSVSASQTAGSRLVGTRGVLVLTSKMADRVAITAFLLDRLVTRFTHRLGYLRTALQKRVVTPDKMINFLCCPSPSEAKDVPKVKVSVEEAVKVVTCVGQRLEETEESVRLLSRIVESLSRTRSGARPRLLDAANPTTLSQLVRCVFTSLFQSVAHVITGSPPLGPLPSPSPSPPPREQVGHDEKTHVTVSSVAHVIVVRDVTNMEKVVEGELDQRGLWSAGDVAGSGETSMLSLPWEEVGSVFCELKTVLDSLREEEGGGLEGEFKKSFGEGGIIGETLVSFGEGGQGEGGVVHPLTEGGGRGGIGREGGGRGGGVFKSFREGEVDEARKFFKQGGGEDGRLRSLQEGGKSGILKSTIEGEAKKGEELENGERDIGGGKAAYGKHGGGEGEACACELVNEMLCQMLTSAGDGGQFFAVTWIVELLGQYEEKGGEVGGGGGGRGGERGGEGGGKGRGGERGGEGRGEERGGGEAQKGGQRSQLLKSSAHQGETIEAELKSGLENRSEKARDRPISSLDEMAVKDISCIVLAHLEAVLFRLKKAMEEQVSAAFTVNDSYDAKLRGAACFHTLYDKVKDDVHHAKATIVPASLLLFLPPTLPVPLGSQTGSGGSGIVSNRRGIPHEKSSLVAAARRQKMSMVSKREKCELAHYGRSPRGARLDAMAPPHVMTLEKYVERLLCQVVDLAGSSEMEKSRFVQVIGDACDVVSLECSDHTHSPDTAPPSPGGENASIDLCVLLTEILRARVTSVSKHPCAFVKKGISRKKEGGDAAVSSRRFEPLPPRPLGSLNKASSGYLDPYAADVKERQRWISGLHRFVACGKRGAGVSELFYSKRQPNINMAVRTTRDVLDRVRRSGSAGRKVNRRSRDKLDRKPGQLWTSSLDQPDDCSDVVDSDGRRRQSVHNPSVSVSMATDSDTCTSSRAAAAAVRKDAAEGGLSLSGKQTSTSNTVNGCRDGKKSTTKKRGLRTNRHISRVGVDGNNSRSPTRHGRVSPPQTPSLTSPQKAGLSPEVSLNLVGRNGESAEKATTDKDQEGKNSQEKSGSRKGGLSVSASRSGMEDLALQGRGQGGGQGRGKKRGEGNPSWRASSARCLRRGRTYDFFPPDDDVSLAAGGGAGKRKGGGGEEDGDGGQGVAGDEVNNAAVEIEERNERKEEEKAFLSEEQQEIEGPTTMLLLSLLKKELPLEMFVLRRCLDDAVLREITPTDLVDFVGTVDHLWSRREMEEAETGPGEGKGEEPKRELLERAMSKEGEEEMLKEKEKEEIGGGDDEEDVEKMLEWLQELQESVSVSQRAAGAVNNLLRHVESGQLTRSDVMSMLPVSEREGQAQDTDRIGQEVTRALLTMVERVELGQRVPAMLTDKPAALSRALADAAKEPGLRVDNVTSCVEIRSDLFRSESEASAKADVYGGRRSTSRPRNTYYVRNEQNTGVQNEPNTEYVHKEQDSHNEQETYVHNELDTYVRNEQATYVHSEQDTDVYNEQDTYYVHKDEDNQNIHTECNSNDDGTVIHNDKKLHNVHKNQHRDAHEGRTSPRSSYDDTDALLNERNNSSETGASKGQDIDVYSEQYSYEIHNDRDSDNSAEYNTRSPSPLVLGRPVGCYGKGEDSRVDEDACCHGHVENGAEYVVEETKNEVNDSGEEEEGEEEKAYKEGWEEGNQERNELRWNKNEEEDIQRDGFAEAEEVEERKGEGQSGEEETEIEKTAWEDPTGKEEEEEEEVEEEIVEEVLEGEDTLIEEEQEPVVSSARESEASEPPVVESDSEGIMVVQETPARVKRRQAKSNDTVTIVISQLSLEEDSPPMLDDNVRQLYVEYWFYDLEFVETPDSLPKPKPHRSIAFNFSKSIPVDMEKHYERRRHLASMLLPNHQDQGRLKFTVVSEPPQTESLDESVNCEEVGVAYVNFQQMLRQGKDIIDEDIDIVDCHDESILVGQLKLTVECVEVLKAIKSEIQIEETY